MHLHPKPTQVCTCSFKADASMHIFIQNRRKYAHKDSKPTQVYTQSSKTDAMVSKFVPERGSRMAGVQKTRSGVPNFRAPDFQGEGCDFRCVSGCRFFGRFFFVGIPLLLKAKKSATKIGARIRPHLGRSHATTKFGSVSGGI